MHALLKQTKLQELKALIEAIRIKTEYIKERTREMKVFNSKVRLFLRALDSQSIVDDRGGNRTGSDNRGGSRAGSRAGNDRTGNKQTISTDPLSNTDPLSSTLLRNTLLGNTLLINTLLRNKIERTFSKNETQKETGMNILGMLEENGRMRLEEIVKSIKMSKYKTIEILNLMVRSKIIGKKFEKGFVYELFRE